MNINFLAEVAARYQYGGEVPIYIESPVAAGLLYYLPNSISSKLCYAGFNVGPAYVVKDFSEQAKSEGKIPELLMMPKYTLLLGSEIPLPFGKNLWMRYEYGLNALPINKSVPESSWAFNSTYAIAIGMSWMR